MVHTILISAHAAAGMLALAAGWLTIRRDRAVPVYLVALVAMVAFLVVALAVDWASRGPAARATFAALTALALYVLWRAVQAVRARRAGGGPQSARFLDHLGFTLVALLVGFVVIGVLDAGAPVWVVVAAAVCSLASGHLSLQRVKAGEARREARAAVAAVSRVRRGAGPQ